MPQLDEYENKLPAHLQCSIVRIDGRNGSNACTIISTLAIRNVLQAATADGAIDVDVEHTCEARECTRETGPTMCWVRIDF